MLEKLYYESKPILCLVLSFSAFQSPTIAPIFKLAAVFLLVTGVFIAYLRMKYRGLIG